MRPRISTLWLRSILSAPLKPNVSLRPPDDVGEELSTLQDAEAHAAIVANELVRNSAQAVTVSVLSEDGILLAKQRHLPDRLLRDSPPSAL
jgi:hypothetical protein